MQKLPPGRYIVEYHMTATKEALEETQKAIEKVKPKYVIIASNKPIPFDFSSYRPVLFIDNIGIYEKNSQQTSY